MKGIKKLPSPTTSLPTLSSIPSSEPASFLNYVGGGVEEFKPSSPSSLPSFSPISTSAGAGVVAEGKGRLSPVPTLTPVPLRTKRGGSLSATNIDTSTSTTSSIASNMTMYGSDTTRSTTTATVTSPAAAAAAAAAAAKATVNGGPASSAGTKSVVVVVPTRPSSPTTTASNTSTVPFSPPAKSLSRPAPVKTTRFSSSTSPSRPTVLIDAYVFLRKRELDWLRSLPPAYQAALDYGRTGTSFCAHQHLYCARLLLSLIGLRPCVVIPPHDIWREGGAKAGKETLQSSYTQELAFFVLRPWMEQFGLKKVGFMLTPLPKLGGKMGGAEGWCFWNETHPKAGIVRRVVLMEKGGVRGTLEQALGLPFLPASTEGRVEVSYNALNARPYHHPEHRYSSLQTSRVPLLSFFSHPSTAIATGTHYRTFADVCASQLHVPLALDIGTCRQFPLEPLTSLLLAAFPAAKRDPMLLYRFCQEGEVVAWGWLKEKMPMIVAEAGRRMKEGGREGGRELETSRRRIVL